jgi:hypothetical protein
VRKLGYKEGKVNKALLRQLVNYVTSVIKVEPKDPIPDRLDFYRFLARSKI